MYIYSRGRVNTIHVGHVLTRVATNIRSLSWFLNVFLASGYSFNVCACSKIEHVKFNCNKMVVEKFLAPYYWRSTPVEY